ncbi:MAG: DUF3823 domain-containing protein [Carboxylicivirga sp.]|jgi:hypothetical protein|nr:DUF3823 domain-containing protein [Carboxylicivirga sp.]
MKKILYILLVGLIVMSCEFDNKPEPKLKFKGNFVCDGKVVPMRNGAVSLRFGQESYPKDGTFDISANQDGMFSGIVFPGEYQVTLPSDKGAYEANSDEIDIKISGNTDYNWEIVPFYLVTSVNYTTSGKKLSVSTSVQKKGTKEIENVRLLISERAICDRVWKDEEVIASDISDLNNIAIEADLTNWSKPYCFVRVAVKSKGNTYYNYSKVEKIDL